MNSVPESVSVHKECEINGRKSTDNRRIPFGKHVFVVILQGGLLGIITKMKGIKMWEVVELGIFKSKQMRRPKQRGTLSQ